MTDMFEAETQVRGIGDNQDHGGDLITPASRLPSADEMEAYLMNAYRENIERTNAIMAKAPDFFTISTDEEDALATEFMVKVRAAWKAAEAARVAEKSPFDDLAGQVQAFFKKNILDPLGAAPPANDKRDFSPAERPDLGVGPRVHMGMTIYKRKIVEAERRRREEEARLLREAEDKARREREEADHKAREEEARIAREAREKREAAEREAREAEIAASRKRSEESRATAAAEAAAARLRAEEARRDEDARNRAAQIERDRLDRENMEKENAAAQARAQAEIAASASAADLSRQRGIKGGVSSLREGIEFRDINRDALAAMPNGVQPGIVELLPYLTDAALEAAARQYAKANRGTIERHLKARTQPVNGVIFYIGSTSSSRA